MLFFKRKKKGKEPPIPKFEFSLQQKENLIEYVIFRNQVSEKSRYQTVFLEILDALIQDACVFLDRSVPKVDLFSDFITKVKEKEDGSYLFDEDRNVIEKGRGIFSILSETPPKHFTICIVFQKKSSITPDLPKVGWKKTLLTDWGWPESPGTPPPA